MRAEYFLFAHHTTSILAKLSTWCFEHSGYISCSLSLSLSVYIYIYIYIISIPKMIGKTGAFSNLDLSLSDFIKMCHVCLAMFV